MPLMLNVTLKLSAVKAYQAATLRNPCAIQQRIKPFLLQHEALVVCMPLVYLPALLKLFVTMS